MIRVLSLARYFTRPTIKKVLLGGKPETPAGVHRSIAKSSPLSHPTHLQQPEKAVSAYLTPRDSD